jgi:hypothetical protein
LIVTYQCLNGRQLLISNEIDIDFFDKKNIEACAVLLTAWNGDSVNIERWRERVRFFIGKKCVFFVCLGTYSEELHDVIDECLFEYDDEYGKDVGVNIITTYHNNESVQDVVNFFIYSTEIEDNNFNFLFAYLDDGCVLDMDVKKCLVLECKLKGAGSI